MANPAELKFIYADTSGGFSGAAMDIAELMTKHDLSLIIGGSCMSACVKFLIPSSKQTIVCEEGVLGDHGDVRHILDALDRETIYDEQPFDVLKPNLVHLLHITIDAIDRFNATYNLDSRYDECAGRYAPSNPPNIFYRNSPDEDFKRTRYVFPVYEEYWEGKPEMWSPSASFLAKMGFGNIIGWTDDVDVMKQRWASRGVDLSLISFDQPIEQSDGSFLCEPVSY